MRSSASSRGPARPRSSARSCATSSRKTGKLLSSRESKSNKGDTEENEMTRRVEYVSVEEARRLGRECGIVEAQASRSAFLMLANHPDLVKHVYGLLTMLSSRNKLPTRLRELIIMRLAWRAGSDYAWFQHYRISTQAGVTPEEIVAVRDWRKSRLFGPADRAVLAAADDTCDQGKI